MKSYTLRFRKVNKKTFELIREDKKTVEMRAATVKYKDIKAGDELMFVCEKNKFTRAIKKVTRFPSIDEMLKEYKLASIHPGFSSIEEYKKLCYGFPGYKEKLKKFGLIALELKKK